MCLPEAEDGKQESFGELHDGWFVSFYSLCVCVRVEFLIAIEAVVAVDTSSSLDSQDVYISKFSFSISALPPYSLYPRQHPAIFNCRYGNCVAPHHTAFSIFIIPICTTHQHHYSFTISYTKHFFSLDLKIYLEDAVIIHQNIRSSDVPAYVGKLRRPVSNKQPDSNWPKTSNNLRSDQIRTPRKACLKACLAYHRRPYSTHERHRIWKRRFNLGRDGMASLYLKCQF